MTNLITYLEKVIEPVNKSANYLACLLIFCLMLLTFSDVMGRYFIRPITGTYELTGVFLVLSVFLGLGYTQIKKGHISLGVLVERFSPRIQAVIEILTNFMILIILMLMAQQTFIYASRSINNVTGELRIPEYIFIFIAGVGIFLFALTVLLDLLKSIQKVVNINHES